MLHDLLHIKKIKEDSAKNEVIKCQYKVEQAVIELKNKEKELEEYLNWRKQEEQRLYDEIMDTCIKERELDLLKQRVALMRDKDVTYQEAIQEAKKKLEEFKQQLSTAKENHVIAMRTVEKFEEFTKVIDAEAAKEAARKEEMELEEFSVKNKF